MSVNLPTKTPSAPTEKPAEGKFDPFRPEMPNIPGVGGSARPAAPVSGGLDSQRILQIGGVAAVVLIVAILGWWIHAKSRATPNVAADSDESTQEAPAPAAPNPVATVHDGPIVAATTEELSKPWAAKKFTFVKPITGETIPAMVIRLPNGEFWAFSLQGPFGRCDLQFVMDLPVLASKYDFNASHPMVVSPCDNTVYDPLKVGPLGGNTWARGEIVKGSSLRPPISIDVKVRGRSIVADSIE